MSNLNPWRVRPLVCWLIVLLTQVLAVSAWAAPIPVIFDTDIGDDIDDTWALAILLRSPELDLKLVTTTCGKAEYRARLVARLLEVAHRTNVPVGLGAGGREGTGGQETWVRDYELKSYAGKVDDDGVQAMINFIQSSPTPVTIISVGPSTTVAAALDRSPSITTNAYFVGMQGSVRKGYDGGPVGPEYNVKENIPAAQKALLAHWKKMTITPLDTCGLVRISGARFEKLQRSEDPLVHAVLENYRIWSKNKSNSQSSILFDTVAVYLALPGSKPLLKLEPLSITVTKDGVTAIDQFGVPMAVATEWVDLKGYEQWIVDRLLSSPAL